MPSPRRPSRAMASRSTTLGLEQLGPEQLGPEQEFAVSLTAEDRGGDDAENAPAERRHGVGQVRPDGGMDPRVADDAFLDLGAAGFELRLDQGDETRGLKRRRERRRQDELE